MIKRCTLILMVLVLAISASGESNRKRQNNHGIYQELAGMLSEQKNASDINLLLTTNKWLHTKFSTLKNAYTHKLDSVVYMGTNVITGTLENEYLDEFVYDEAWRATSIIEKEWMPDAGEWEIWAQTEIAYNESGLVEQFINNTYEDGSLIPQSKIEVYYDADNRVDSIYWYSTNDTDTILQLRIKQYYHYNSSGALTQASWVVYDDEAEEWIVDMQTRLTYDTSGRKESMGVYFFMEGEDDAMEEMLWQMVEYLYNDAGQLIRSETEAIGWTGELQPFYKTEYTYDTDGDLSSITGYIWDDWDEETWVPEYRDDYVYRANLNFVDVAYPYAAFATIFADIEDGPSELLKAIDEVSVYWYLDGDFTLTEKEIYYYSPTSGTTDEYTLRYYAGSNGQIVGEATQTVPQGGNGTEVEAVPNEGYHFTEWSDGVTTPKRTDTNVSSNITVTASFAANTYTITAGPNNAAYGSVSGTGDYSHGQTATLTATSSNAQIYVFINWTENGNMVHEAAEYTFTVTENRNLIAHFQNVTTVNEITQSPAINTFPNPAKYSLTIESPVVIKNISVYDTTGRQIIFKIINDSQHELNTSSLRAGTYILQTNTTEGSATTRFLVE